jgi:hypothetical protein
VYPNVANDDDCREVLWDRVRVMLLRRELLREETVDQDEGPHPEPTMKVSHVS